MSFDIFSQVTPKIGIDLGTARTRIWSSSAGFAVDEATCIAVDQSLGKVLAVGDEAAQMRGRVAGAVRVFQPVKRGEVTDNELLQAFLRVLLQRVFTTFTFFRPQVMVSIPAGLSPAKRDIVVETMFAVGAKEVYTMSQPLAAAIGSGVPIADSSGTFLFHLGAGVVEAAVISLGSVVLDDSLTLGGNKLDQVIVQRTKEAHELIISLRTAEMLKQMVASLDDQANRSIMTSGQDIHHGSPKEVSIDANSLFPKIETFSVQYQDLLQRLLSGIPPELTADVIDKGLLLTGGLASLHGLKDAIVSGLGVPVTVVDDPEQVVIRGISTALEHLDEFKESLGYLG